MPSPECILNTSPNAAVYRTDIHGWVSSDGRYWGDNSAAEVIARREGATHIVCDDCGGIYPSRTYCSYCRKRRSLAAFYKLPVIDWDGVTPVCLWDTDTYFFDLEAIRDYCEDFEDEAGNSCPLHPEALKLVLCIPIVAKEVDISNWEDWIEKDDEIPDWLEEAVGKLNETIREHRDEPLAWFPGKIRVRLRTSLSPLWPARSG